jgi:hypothetical protein
LNVKLLRRVKKHILELPNRFIMGDWIEKLDPGTVVKDYEAKVTVPACGTVACLAGWTYLLAKGKEIDCPRDEAEELLGITHDEGRELFYTDDWPADLAEDFESSSDPQERAEIAGKRIDRFIAEHERIDRFIAEHEG